MEDAEPVRGGEGHRFEEKQIPHCHSLTLKADKQLLNNYQINQDTCTVNADRKMKADMANQNAGFDTESINANSAEQAWADQLKLLQYQLQYAYT